MRGFEWRVRGWGFGIWLSLWEGIEVGFSRKRFFILEDMKLEVGICLGIGRPPFFI